MAVKKFFLNSTKKKNVFRKHAPNIRMPPSPNVTRWTPWLEAAAYFADYNTRRQVFLGLVATTNEMLECEDWWSPAKVWTNKQKKQELQAFLDVLAPFCDPFTIEEITYVANNFVFMVSSIKGLEKSGLTLFEEIDIVEEVRTLLHTVPIDFDIARKFNQVFKDNEAYSDLLNFKNGQPIRSNSPMHLLSEDDLRRLKYAPIVNIEVERQFSRYKAIYAENRQRFLFENLRMFIITNVNINKVNLLIFFKFFQFNLFKNICVFSYFSVVHYLDYKKPERCR